MNYTTTPNMLLIEPTVGVEIGPAWASEINGDMTRIDGHNHTTGLGVQIPTAGLNINADLSINQNNLTNVRSVRFYPSSSPLGLPQDLGALYVSGVDLWYNDENGTQIRITQNGAIGTSTPIPGLAAPASLTYSPISDSFIFQSGIGIPALIDAGSIIVRQLNSPYSGITIAAPSALVSGGYTATLPTNAPVSSGSFLTMATSGAISNNVTVDGSTITVNGSNQLVSSPQQEHNWELNGPYPTLTYPLANIDAIFFAPRDITINSVWIYNGNAGTSGTTVYDLEVLSPGGSPSSILSTTGKITSAAAPTIWTDSGTVIGAQTGVTKPVIGTTAITAGQAIFFTLTQSMAGPATDARIRIYYS